MRHQVFLTDAPYASGGSLQFLDARHRAHARVEDRIRRQPQEHPAARRAPVVPTRPNTTPATISTAQPTTDETRRLDEERLAHPFAINGDAGDVDGLDLAGVGDCV